MTRAFLAAAACLAIVASVVGVVWFDAGLLWLLTWIGAQP